MIQIEKTTGSKTIGNVRQTYYKDRDPEVLKRIFDPQKRESHIVLPVSKRVQSEAMNVSMSNGALPLFAQDDKKKTEMEKEYLASSYATIFYYIKNKILIREERNLYELMLDNVPCDLYADLDISLERNPNFGNFEHIQRDFIVYVKYQMIEYGYCNSESDVETLILDSTDATKISRHYIFRLKNGKMFKNVMQCGAFMRNLRNNIQNREGVDPHKNRFFAWTKRKKEEERNDPLKALCFILDMGIYTSHRVFRLCGCTKFGKKSYLKPIDENGVFLGDFDTMKYEDFAKYFVQRNAKHIGDHPDNIVCLEPDGSNARSTSDLLIFRPDLNPVISKKVWKDHYDSYYPFEKIWKWVGHPNREFCFEYPTNSQKGRVGIDWKRYVFFDNCFEFETYVKKNLPIGIHIGAICETNSKSDAKMKELVFDIDLDEYVDSKQNSLRGCCGKEKKCCDVCWQLALIAKVILEEVLKKFMGFKKVKFFFSGGRGMHCWVLDPEIMNFSRESREAILKRFDSIKKVPKSLEMKSIIQKFTKEYLLGVMKSLGCGRGSGSGSGDEIQGHPQYQYSKSDLILLFWPKFDLGPTTQLSHVIKSPFSLHKTSLQIAKQLKRTRKE